MSQHISASSGAIPTATTPSPHLLGGTSSSGHTRWGQDQSPSHSPHWGCRCSLFFWSSHPCPPKWTLQWPVKQKESGKVRTSPPGLQERVTDRVGDKGGLEAWGHTCASVYASVQRAWILCFQLRCNWHNIMLVSGIQHNASIFVYVVKWLPAREILGLRQVCLWEKKKKDETGARISGKGVHGCSYLSFPVFVSVLMSFSPSTPSLPHV